MKDLPPVADKGKRIRHEVKRPCKHIGRQRPEAVPGSGFLRFIGKTLHERDVQGRQESTANAPDADRVGPTTKRYPLYGLRVRCIDWISPAGLQSLITPEFCIDAHTFT